VLWGGDTDPRLVLSAWRAFSAIPGLRHPVPNPQNRKAAYSSPHTSIPQLRHFSESRQLAVGYAALAMAHLTIPRICPLAVQKLRSRARGVGAEVDVHRIAIPNRLQTD
jgi:hypothetical protein